MRIVLALLLAFHGLIHLLGPAKALGWTDVSQLRTPMSSAATACIIIVAAGTSSETCTPPAPLPP